MPNILISRGRRCLALLTFGLLLGCGFAASSARAAGYQNLAVVAPTESCDQLGKTDLSGVADAAATIQSAKIVNTAKGDFCEVRGNVAPAIGFAVDLPTEHWTQRYLEVGCGGMCGSIRVQIEHATGCVPALNGEFVVASDNMGHQNVGMGMGDNSFAKDPQKIIDFAYRGNHETTLVTKALIKAFYGQPQRYAYFMGCSDGGREALTEAERYPNDFDGISAGAVVAMFSVQNSFYHIWTTMSDRRADGSYILSADKIAMLHAAVLAHCATLSGVSDGLLQDPRACDFDPATIACPQGAADTSKCLTGEELNAVQRIYAGANDGQGNYFTFGAMKGSELTWHFPTASKTPPAGGGNSNDAQGVRDLIVNDPTDDDAKMEKFAFTTASYQRMIARSALYNATNTDLKPFAAHGGKLIMFHGLADTSVTPSISIAYYQGVQKLMGVAATDQFLRLFLIAGMSHCGGGDGYDQFDLLSPLMAWTEQGQAPAALVTAKLPAAAGGFGGPGGPGGPAGQRPKGGMGGGGSNPVAAPAGKYLATRPVYPFPYLPRYTGQGDPNDATNYAPVMSPVGNAPITGIVSLALIGPDNQTFYHVAHNQLVGDKAN